MDIKARIDTFITDTGVVSVLDVDNEDQVRIVVENADYSNIIQIRGRLRGQSSSFLLKEIFGIGNEKVNVSTYEQLVIECTALQPDMGVGSVRIIASSFNLASGSAISIDVPAGSDLTDIETLTFISGDNSISIEGSNSSKTIDLQVQNPLAFTPEDVANKSSNTSLGTSDILYPTQNAVKTYVDAIAVSGAPDADATTKGILKLTGDLGGTADSPTVPALADKQDTLVSTTNIKSINGQSILGSGDLIVGGAVDSVNTKTGVVVLDKTDIGLANVDNTSDADKPISTATQNALNLITDVSWTGPYDNGRTYVVGEGVMFNGASFRMIAFIGAAGYTPVAYPSNWLQVTDYVSADDIGLGNVDNTTDLDKPISTATQDALNLKQDSLTFTPEDVANKSSDINLGTSDVLYPTQNAVKTYVDSVSSAGAPDADATTKGILKLTGDLGGTADSPTVPGLASKYDASNPSNFVDAAGASAAAPVQSVAGKTGIVSLDKTDVGLSNVDNTSDLDKPISSATQTALNEKYDASNPDGYITLADIPADAVTSVNGLTGAVVIPTSSLIIQDEGTSVTSAAISMNFLGAGVTASSDVSGNVTVSISGAGDATTLIVEGYNQTGSAIPIMSVVYISGAHGNLPNLVLSQANIEATSSKTLGITRFDISNMSNGFVVATGRLEGLNTDIVGWNEGDSLWLSPSIAGGITNTKPSAPNHSVFLGTLIRKHPTQGVIEVKVQNGFELQELHNVSINGSLLDNQVLKYDAPNLLWRNETLTKDDVGLANVDNTSDLDKPISSATQSALNAKADSSHTHALTDLTQSSATNGQVPTWNGSNWVASTPESVITDHTALTNIGTYTHAQIDSHIPASSNVHGIGASSDVVGTATSQTLTNKTIDYNSNTILNLPSGGGASYSDVTISALDIDWSAGTTFYKDISVSSTFTFSNIVAGKTITVVIYNSAASAVNVTLPTVKKETGAFDTAIVASTANVYVFSSINGSVYASSITEVV